KHFDRNGAVQSYLPGAVNHTHAATPDFFQQFVIAEPGRGYGAPIVDRRAGVFASARGEDIRSGFTRQAVPYQATGTKPLRRLGIQGRAAFAASLIRVQDEYQARRP